MFNRGGKPSHQVSALCVCQYKRCHTRKRREASGRVLSCSVCTGCLGCLVSGIGGTGRPREGCPAWVSVEIPHPKRSRRALPSSGGSRCRFPPWGLGCACSAGIPEDTQSQGAAHAREATAKDSLCPCGTESCGKLGPHDPGPQLHPACLSMLEHANTLLLHNSWMRSLGPSVADPE